MNDQSLRYLTTTVRFLALFIMLVFSIRLFFLEPSSVVNRSMEPTFKSGDALLVDKFTPLFFPLQRGQIVEVFNPREQVTYLKRIIGLPGEHITVRGLQVTIREASGTEIKLNEPYVKPPLLNTPNPWTVPLNSDVDIPDNAYFVMGDNRPISNDSRSFGPVLRSNIFGIIHHP